MAVLSIRVLRKIVLGTAIAAACVTIWAAAYADINDRPFFRASSIAIVIGVDGFVMNSNNGWDAGNDFSDGTPYIRPNFSH